MENMNNDQPPQQQPQAAVMPTTPDPQPAPSRLPTAGTMLSKAWSLFQNRLNALLTVTIIGMLIIFVIGFIFGGSSFFATGRSHTALLGIGGLITSIVAIIIGVIQQGALITVVASDHPITWQDAYRAGSKRFWALLGAALLVGIAVVIGFVLFVIPGVILAVWFCVTAFCLMLENKGIMDSIKQSKAYVKGRWSETAWRLSVLIVIVIIVSIPVAVLGAFNPLVGQLLNLIFSVMVTPFVVCYSYILYRSLRGEPI